MSCEVYYKFNPDIVYRGGCFCYRPCERDDTVKFLKNQVEFLVPREFRPFIEWTETKISDDKNNLHSIYIQWLYWPKGKSMDEISSWPLINRELLDIKNEVVCI
jgi:hypothetical protein